MTVAGQIIQLLKSRGITKTWLADKLGLSKQTLNYRLTHNSFTAEELLQIGKVLNIDLNEWK